MTASQIREAASRAGLPVYGRGGLADKTRLNPSTFADRQPPRVLQAQTLVTCACVIADHAKRPRIDVLAEITGIDLYKITRKNGRPRK